MVSLIYIVVNTFCSAEDIANSCKSLYLDKVLTEALDMI